MTFDPCDVNVAQSLLYYAIGKKVPLSIQNDLLALVAYEGLGNTSVTSEDLSDVFVNWPRKLTSTQSVESGTREEGQSATERSSEEGDSLNLCD